MRRAQRGYALIAAIALGALVVAALIVTNFSAGAIKNVQQRKTAEALAQAKEALIGYAVSHVTDTTYVFQAGWLPCPDTSASDEGVADTPCGGLGKNSAVGRFPWRTLGLPAIRDGAGECLWYVVSTNFKNSTSGASPTSPAQINKDSAGTLQVRDATGETLKDSSGNPLDIAAIVFAPGGTLGNKKHASNSKNCGDTDSTNGTTGVSQYLEALNTPLGNFNNAKIAGNATDDFVTAPATDNFNDQLVYITRDDITNLVRKAIPDVPTAIANLSTADLQAFAINKAYALPLNDVCSGCATHQGQLPFRDQKFSASPIELGLVNYLEPNAYTYFVSHNCTQAACDGGTMSVTDNVSGANYANVEAALIIRASTDPGTRTVTIDATTVPYTIAVIVPPPTTPGKVPTVNVLR